MAQYMRADALPVFFTYLLTYSSPLVLVASKMSSASAKAFLASAMKPSTSALWKYWNTPETMMSVGSEVSMPSAQERSNASPAMSSSRSGAPRMRRRVSMTSGRSIS